MTKLLMPVALALMLAACTTVQPGAKAPCCAHCENCTCAYCGDGCNDCACGCAEGKGAKGGRICPKHKT